MNEKSKRHLLHILIPILLITFFQCSDKKMDFDKNLNDSITDISVLSMDGKQVNLSDYNGKVLMIVNVASECGNTPQYEQLQAIYNKYNEQGFEILAFPCNDFGGQEPGTNEEIKTFCENNYSVTFRLFDKIKILGDDKCPLYERLTNNIVTEKSDIGWNFEKFIISKKGKIVSRFKSKVLPDNKSITDIIERELAKS
jgi:glutathione peroxidase